MNPKSLMQRMEAPGVSLLLVCCFIVCFLILVFERLILAGGVDGFHLLGNLHRLYSHIYIYKVCVRPLFSCEMRSFEMRAGSGRANTERHRTHSVRCFTSMMKEMLCCSL